MGILVSIMIYYSLLVPFFNGANPYLALIIVLGGFIGWLLGAESTTQQPHNNGGKARRGFWSRLVARLRVGVLVGLSSALIFGLIFGLGGMLLQAALEKSNRAASSFQAPQRSRKLKWQHPLKSAGVRNGILVGLLIGLSFGLSKGLSSALSFEWSVSSARILGLSYGLSFGLSFGLIGGFLSVLLIGKPVGITLTDELVWSWSSLRRSLLAKKHRNTTLRLMALIGLSVALSSALSYGLSIGRSYALSDALGEALSYTLSVGLSVGLGVWLLLGLFQGVSSETIRDQHRVVPNQGIHRSARNCLVLGLISTGIVLLVFTLSSALSIALSSALSYGLSIGLISVLDGLISVLGDVLSIGLSDGLSGLSNALSIGLIIGLSAGLLAGLLNGGLACLRHGVIRLLLWRAGSIPWNYPRFLDYAAEHLLLRKVGGGYIFLHQLLLDYFANFKTGTDSDATVEDKQERLPPETMPSSSVEPTGVDEPLELPTTPLAPTPVLPEALRLLSCGHELRTPNARFCSVCGAPVPSSSPE